MHTLPGIVYVTPAAANKTYKLGGIKLNTIMYPTLQKMNC